MKREVRGLGTQQRDPDIAARYDALLSTFDRPQEAAPAVASPRPVSLGDRSGNALRPARFSQVIGQQRTKAVLERIVGAARASGDPMDHALMVGPSGMGKTTLALVLANELGRRLFVMNAPVDRDQLIALGQVARDGDILLVDEIHLWAMADRRGRSSVAEPEVCFELLEDRTITTDEGRVRFPAITMIGATTDVGRLPEAFRNRFPLQPRLEDYSEHDMAQIAGHNAHALGLQITTEAVYTFARASRKTPRVVNSYIRNAAALCSRGTIEEGLAREVVGELNRTEPDGLTEDMARMLVFLLENGRRETAAGDVSYVAGVNTLATALGMSRDSKSIVLYVEPELIRRGFISVGQGGRRLTERGIDRARELAA